MYSLLAALLALWHTTGSWAAALGPFLVASVVTVLRYNITHGIEHGCTAAIRLIVGEPTRLIH